MNNLVSIIMPCYNNEATIGKAVESVQRQTYIEWELLITDDGSIDGSVELIERLASSDKRIKFFSLQKNGGAGVARNNSIKNAVGRYIAFLDADDSWDPEKLDCQITFMKENGVALTYSAYQKIKGGDLAGVVMPPEKITYKELIYSNVIGCLTAVYDSHLLGKRYMPIIRKRQDMGLWLDILKDIEVARATPGVLGYYNCDSGMTKNKLSVLGYQWRFYRDVVELGVVRSLWVFCVYAFRGCRKSMV
ncbi:glycosyltransferase family 2 protein [Marinagarivorans algicola]|uniref:glycosyltransferase family 2 protein n=1 Tax=Marinagarivorans algicola TaxID=1513270 RepID=UPI0006B8F399|nr:glycosyltransferase family 2 protein [Marinagarivorans algicola]